MKKCLAIFAFAAVALSANAQKPVELFNGKNLEGWSSYTKFVDDIADEVYTVKDKCITLSGDFGYLYTNEQYSDYKLTFEWRWVDEPSNSGLFLNMQGENKAWPTSYEVQLRDSDVGYFFHVGGTESDESRAGNSKKANYRSDLLKPTGEWNKMEVVNSATLVSVHVNGVLQNELHNISQSSGHIGFQSEGEAIQFRNVELTPLK